MAKYPKFVNGRRSGLEVKVSKQLEELGVDYGYETVKLKYTVPSREAKYTPDFVFPNSNIVIETKGYFRSSAERQKMLHVKAANPELDIRFVFQKANKPIYKGSPTSYSKWCEDNGFIWADNGTIPDEWIKEIENG